MKRKRDLGEPETLSPKRFSELRPDLEPASLTRPISPPIVSRRQPSQLTATTAEVEAGEKNVEDPLTFFSSKLHAVSQATSPDVPRIGYQSWVDLYRNNIDHPQGHHFVIHQHDHPISGTHYDLRLQCNETSSVSWAIMYGLPGDPNSRRLNRNATETRIHCLWNHLVETASHQTGTLLIWDTGHYEVLPYHEAAKQSADQTTDEEESEPDENIMSDPRWSSLSEPERLHQSFRNRKIRLRLHGTRLPRNYTISLRLSKDNDRDEQPAAPKRRRKRNEAGSSKITSSNPDDDDSDTDRHHDSQSSSAETKFTQRSPRLRRKLSSLYRHESPPASSQKPPTAPATTMTPVKRINSKPQTSASTNTTENLSTSNTASQTQSNTQELIRLTNAYPGATNSINSIHQRKWYLSLDPTSSGFTRSSRTSSSDRERWTFRQPVDSSPGRSTYPFHVLGPSCERSVVTGRLARDVLDDEGVVGYVPRGRWRAVVE